ncbi:c-type cytochrome biogenesis protein CcsB [Brachybacterium sp. ACRRE]|uniref:c-type cytochrome biogenesis protein CcsB n=1 Tax=Brachybacterium sp. ACRRE TaxID=2918184 RepID=UPI001EF1FA47|nr:c-type cytochrome biogenesis protein CcsB [Brachybacterium sp. ACRRE]MCG7308498.1 c-type cytochrome biogenesis protein CcsB [Brachybacterium sp. ACRRE]
MTIDYFSNLALVTATVIYALALTMHSIEWAAARKVTAARNTADGREREAADDIETGTHPDARAQISRASEASASTVTITRTVAQAPPDPPTSEHERPTDDALMSDSMPQRRTQMFGRLGISFTLIGLMCAIAGVAARGIAAHRWPLGNMFEFTTMAMVLIVAGYLVLAKMGMRWLGLPITMIATVGNGLAVTVFYVAVAGLVPSLSSYWFIIHITAATISGATFNIGGAVSILYMIKKRAENKGTDKGYLLRLPDSRRMDVIAYRLFAFAFPLWTFTIAAGAVWAEYAWGRYWGWDPKEVWALVTWVIFACYLHARSTAGWKGARAAVIALLGVAVFWFNFIGVNLLLAGLHSYAGI